MFHFYKVAPEKNLLFLLNILLCSYVLSWFGDSSRFYNIYFCLQIDYTLRCSISPFIGIVMLL